MQLLPWNHIFSFHPFALQNMLSSCFIHPALTKALTNWDESSRGPPRLLGAWSNWGTWRGLKDPGLYKLKKGRLRVSKCSFQLPKGVRVYTEVTVSLRGTQQEATDTNCKQTKFWLLRWKKLYTVRAIKPWNRGPERLWNLHPWKHSKFSLKRSWATWSNKVVPALSRELDQTTSRGPFQTVFSIVTP